MNTTKRAKSQKSRTSSSSHPLWGAVESVKSVLSLVYSFSRSPSTPSASSPPFFILISTVLIDPCDSRHTSQFAAEQAEPLQFTSVPTLKPPSSPPMAFLPHFVSDYLSSPLETSSSSSVSAQTANQRRAGYNSLSGEGCVHSILSYRVFANPLFLLSGSSTARSSPSSTAPKTTASSSLLVLFLFSSTPTSTSSARTRQENSIGTMAASFLN
jgi:hypothetical protein